MDKFQNKYRIASARAQWWNYSNEGLYFITICTKDHEPLFGEIKSEKMVLSAIGEILKKEWLQSFEIRKELHCEEYVIMPNHIHAILQIKNDEKTNGNQMVVETHGRASLQYNNGIAYRSPKSISSFVAGFKSTATTKINQYRNKPKLPVWQNRFHDRIIRDFEEFHRIQNYIIDNPKNWTTDKLYGGEM